MNVVDAAHKTVKDYPGGAEALGPRVGINPTVLRSKVNPTMTSHRLAIEEADLIIGATGNPLMLQALAETHGYGLVPLSDHAGNGSVLDLVLGHAESEGDFAAEVRAALADGLITQNEYTRIAAAAHVANETTLLLLGALRRLKGNRTDAIG